MGNSFAGQLLSRSAQLKAVAFDEDWLGSDWLGEVSVPVWDSLFGPAASVDGALREVTLTLPLQTASGVAVQGEITLRLELELAAVLNLGRFQLDVRPKLPLSLFQPLPQLTQAKGLIIAGWKDQVLDYNEELNWVNL